MRVRTREAHPGRHRRKMCGRATWPAGVLGELEGGPGACGPRWITQDRKMQREGLGACDGSELEYYFDSEKQHNCTSKCTMGSRARTGSEARSDGGQPGPAAPVGGRFRQPDRTSFFRLTPAFRLRVRSLRMNGYDQC